MLVVNILGAIVKFALPWESILSFLLEMIANIIKGEIGKTKFTKVGKYATMGGYVLADGLGDHLVSHTKTKTDDKFIEEFKGLCEEAASKHNFKLPKVEEL